MRAGVEMIEFLCGFRGQRGMGRRQETPPGIGR